MPSNDNGDRYCDRYFEGIAFMLPRCTLPGSATRHKLGIQKYKDRAARQIATLFERAA